MSLLVAVPVILPPRADVLASWTHRPHLVFVNGNQHLWTDPDIAHDWRVMFDPIGAEQNRGVAYAWNCAFRNATVHGDTYVALMSQTTLLNGGTQRLAELVEEHADWRGLLTDFAWHCIVLSVALWEQVGPFDETFAPAYFEDSDYLRRMFLAGLHTPDNRMAKVERDVLDGAEEFAATLNAGLIDPNSYGRNAARYVEKWNGNPFNETWTRPYDCDSYEPENNWAQAEARQ